MKVSLNNYLRQILNVICFSAKKNPISYHWTPTCISSFIYFLGIKTWIQGRNILTKNHWKFPVINTSNKKVTQSLFLSKIILFAAAHPLLVSPLLYMSQESKLGFKGKTFLKKFTESVLQSPPPTKKIHTFSMCEKQPIC